MDGFKFSLDAGSPDLRAIFSHSNLTFKIDGLQSTPNIVDGIALSPLVATQLSVDSCARQFSIPNSQISFKRFSFLESAPLLQPVGNPAAVAILSPSAAVIASLLSFDALDDFLTDNAISVESEDWFCSWLLSLGPSYCGLLRHLAPEFLSAASFSSFAAAHISVPMESIWSSVVNRLAPPIDSHIIPRLPDLLAEFRGMRFNLLYRAGSDFAPAQFRRHCDDHGNTLTLIEDTDGNVFGGFTPVKWQRAYGWPRDPGRRADPSLRSFLFSLVNPKGIPMRFPLKREESFQAINCGARGAPAFGGDPPDLCVAVEESYSWSRIGVSLHGFGNVYDAGPGAKYDLLAKDPERTLRQIEVFEIID
jgi:hypothetical protein